MVPLKGEDSSKDHAGTLKGGRSAVPGSGTTDRQREASRVIPLLSGDGKRLGRTQGYPSFHTPTPGPLQPGIPVQRPPHLTSDQGAPRCFPARLEAQNPAAQWDGPQSL